MQIQVNGMLQKSVLDFIPGWYVRPNPDDRKNNNHKAKKMTTWPNQTENLNIRAKIGLTDKV